MNDYFEINNVNNYWAQQANQRADKARMDAQDAINKQHQAESNNKSNVDAITHAMNNYQKYNLNVFNKDLDKAKIDLLANLEQVLQSKETVKKIKKDKNESNYYDS